MAKNDKEQDDLGPDASEEGVGAHSSSESDDSRDAVGTDSSRKGAAGDSGAGHRETEKGKAAARASSSGRRSVEEQRDDVTAQLDEQSGEAPVAVTTVFRLPPEKESEFLSRLDELAEATRRMSGLHAYSYHKRRGRGADEASYMVYEDWQSVDRFRTQWQSGHLISFQHEVDDFLSDEPEIELLHGSDDVGGAPIPKTGLTRCWGAMGNEIDCDQGHGQDAAVSAGVDWPSPRFEDHGDGTVTDRLTDLVWLKDADRFGEVTWGQALEKARFLEAGSHGLDDGSSSGDWRLPNIRELRSLLDYSAVAPMIPTDHPFANVQGAIYWTSTTLASAPALAWMTTMGIGPAVFDLKFNANARMWPVRGTGRVAKTGQVNCWDVYGQEVDCGGTGQDGELRRGVTPPTPRFVASGDGTVLDKLTGLVWLQNANPFGWSTWQQALERCRELASGQHGLSDGSKAGHWRLPNVLELESLVDYGRFAPSLPPDHKFENVGPTSYWTSTTVSSAPTQAMFSIFGVGPSIFENKEHPFLVWPVRDAR